MIRQECLSDVQIRGPFRSWRHRHIVGRIRTETVLRDEVEYELPIPIFGPLAAPVAVKLGDRKMFDYRHQVTKEWCESDLTV